MARQMQFDLPTDGNVPPENKRQIKDFQQLSDFMFAGNATLTVKSIKSGDRFTYRIKRPNPPKEGENAGPVSHFVGVLTGPDNYQDYTYLGHIFRESRDYVHGRKSTIGVDAPSAIAWQWFYDTVIGTGRILLDRVEIWHEGRCGACNRKLTVPESIETGLGPECAARLGIKGR